MNYKDWTTLKTANKVAFKKIAAVAEVKDSDDNITTTSKDAYTVLESLNISPPVGIKARNFYNTLQTWEYNEDISLQMGLDEFDNPIYPTVSGGVQLFTNLPTSKIYNKTRNVREALNSQNEEWKRIAMFLGWSSWSLGIESQAIIDAEGKLKEIKKEIKEEKKIIKLEEKKVEQEVVIEENVQKQVEERESGKEVTCAAVNNDNERCSNETVGEGKFCTVHQETEKREDGEKVQCSKIKDDGKRCGMKTNNKSGLCYYHD